MQHEGYTHCLETLPRQVGAGLRRRRRQLFTEHVREVDPGLFENAAALQYTAFSTAATWPVPGVAVKRFFAVQQFELGDDPALQRLQVVFDLVDVAHALPGLNTRPVSSSLISEGPLAGPHSPGTT